MVCEKDEGGIIISKDCVDIISTSADPTRNFYRVRFRNPKLFVGGKYSTPQWGQKAAMTIGTKYYGVKGCKITMAQPVGGRWVIQNVLIPKNGGVEMNEELALKIANHIQDRIEREGEWTAVMCRDNETKRYISKIKGQHIERDEQGRFAPHAAEEFGAEGEIFNRGDILQNATVVGTFEVIDGIIPSLNLRNRWEETNRLQNGTWTLYRITYPSEGYFSGDDRPVMYYALYDNPETLHRQVDWFEDTWYDFESFDFLTESVSLCNIPFRVKGETQFHTKIQHGDTGHPKIIALRIIKRPPILFNGWFNSDYSMDSFNYRLEYGFSGIGVMTAYWPKKIGDVKDEKIGENILTKFKEDIELRGGESRLQTYTRSWDGRDMQPTVIATLFVDFPHFPQYRINLVRWPVLMGVKNQDGLEAEEFGASTGDIEMDRTLLEEQMARFKNDPEMLKEIQMMIQMYGVEGTLNQIELLDDWIKSEDSKNKTESTRRYKKWLKDAGIKKKDLDNMRYGAEGFGAEGTLTIHNCKKSGCEGKLMFKDYDEYSSAKCNKCGDYSSYDYFDAEEFGAEGTGTTEVVWIKKTTTTRNATSRAYSQSQNRHHTTDTNIYGFFDSLERAIEDAQMMIENYGETDASGNYRVTGISNLRDDANFSGGRGAYFSVNYEREGSASSGFLERTHILISYEPINKLSIGYGLEAEEFGAEEIPAHLAKWKMDYQFTARNGELFDIYNLGDECLKCGFYEYYKRNGIWYCSDCRAKKSGQMRAEDFGAEGNAQTSRRV